MVNMIAYIENHHADFCQQIMPICKPLDNLQLAYFHFIRSYHNGSRISLSNHRTWSEYYYKNQFYLNPAYDKNLNSNHHSHMLWLPLKDHHIFRALREEFNIDHGITITRVNPLYQDQYYFGTNPENTDIYELYLNKIQLLERFSYHFLEAAKKIIKKANQDRLYLPIIPSSNDKNLLVKNNSISSFIRQTSIKKYSLVINNKLVSISKRELQCVMQLQKGMSIKTAALSLGLSYRTTRHYLNNLKLKLNCYSTHDLVLQLGGEILQPETDFLI